MSGKTIAIAIDGPAGAGKSTIARLLSQKLSYIYVDTGALYRTVAYGMGSLNVDISDVNAVVDNLSKLKIDIKHLSDGQHVFLNGNDVSGFIRTPEISMLASTVSKIPEVREFLLGLQRQLAEEHNVVMDGRDIATVVLPNAKVKIFLTASPKVRAKRRYDELIAKGVSVDYEDVLSELIQRDEQDMNREIAPLKPSEESIIVDTTDLDLDSAVNAMFMVVEKAIG